MKSQLDLKDSNISELFQIVAQLKTENEVRRFLLDLCTPNEIVALADRWKVARLVNQGRPYREISDSTGVSTATITRVGRSIKFGEGYELALRKWNRRRTL